MILFLTFSFTLFLFSPVHFLSLLFLIVPLSFLSALCSSICTSSLSSLYLVSAVRSPRPPHRSYLSYVSLFRFLPGFFLISTLLPCLSLVLRKAQTGGEITALQDDERGKVYNCGQDITRYRTYYMGF